jgi:hypothetical protein
MNFRPPIESAADKAFTGRAAMRIPSWLLLVLAGIFLFGFFKVLDDPTYFRKMISDLSGLFG